MPPNEITLNETDLTDPANATDAIARLTAIADLVVRTNGRVSKAVGAIPPGPPQDPKLVAALQSLQSSGSALTELMLSVLQRQ